MGGDTRRSVIEYMNRRERFAFIQGTHVAKDLGMGDYKSKKKVKHDLNRLERAGFLQKRTMHLKGYSVVTYARFAPEIPEDGGFEFIPKTDQD